jgi:hypothetical protein
MSSLKSSSVSQQYYVYWATSDESVSLKLDVMVILGVAPGSNVGVYQDVVKLGTEVTAVAETHEAKREEALHASEISTTARTKRPSLVIRVSLTVLV